jgi:hypothetical protein
MKNKSEHINTAEACIFAYTQSSKEYSWYYTHSRNINFVVAHTGLTKRNRGTQMMLKTFPVISVASEARVGNIKHNFCGISSLTFIKYADRRNLGTLSHRKQ